jgi:type IV pilus assembly protein PilZ
VVEKRVHPRISIDMPVVCEGEPTITGMAKDLSMGGLFIEAETVPAFGSKLNIVCRLPGAAADSKLPAVVRWSKPGGFGVQFGPLGARETHVIAGLLRY